MVVALILLALLAFSLLANFGQMMGSLADFTPPRHHAGGPRMEEIVVENNHSENKVAVISIEGIITSQRIDGTAFNMVDVVEAQLDRADRDPDVKAVVLRVDSPGGEVMASDDIAKALTEFQELTEKPVVVSMGNLAASGGYYVAAPCRWIVANEMTITGSIGVIMSGFNYRGLMDKVGLQPVVYKSGRFKDMLSGSRKPEDVSPEEQKMVQGLIDEVYGKFKTVVADGRAAANDANASDGRKLVEDWASYADGRVFSGKEAFELGFVDELGDFDTAVERAIDLAGELDANVIEYRQIIELADLFRLFGQSEPATVKVDLGVQTPNLKPGWLYFLYTEYIN